MKSGVLFSKEEIVRRATCKFVRNFCPPPTLVPSRQEKRDTEGRQRGGEGGGKADATLEEDEGVGEEKKRNKRWEESGSFLFLALGDLCEPEIARPPRRNETSRGKRVEKAWEREAVG